MSINAFHGALPGVVLSWDLDGWIMLIGVLSAVSAALVGNFLVLRKMSMLGDAISHAVLPGLAAAFLISNSRNSLVMFLGAVIVGLLTAAFTEWIRQAGRVDEGASMGVVFTSLFALGLLMIVQAADHVDLDPGCVLYGAIESAPFDTWDLVGWQLPRSAVVLAAVTCLNLLFTLLFFKELKISSFDAALSTTLGIPAWLMHYLLMTLVAITAVASFESVGNILVVAMLVVPPASAYMLTDRLGRMIAWSVALSVVAAVTGHLAAVYVPEWFGYHSTSTAGMMAVMTGVLFCLAALCGPHYGMLPRAWRRQSLARRILQEDIIALLYRMDERGQQQPQTTAAIAENLLASPWLTRFSLQLMARRGLLSQTNREWHLTPAGIGHAQQLIRAHRLWESYLNSEAGLAPERIHDSAERLEHFTGSELNRRLNAAAESPKTDPHGRPIPGDETSDGAVE